MAANGGLITLDDLKAYKASSATPLTGTYKGYGIITAPPPSSGGIGILQMLGVLEGSGYEKGGWGSAATIHYLAETMRRYYADRSEYLGDPDFYEDPRSRSDDPDYLKKLRIRHRPEQASTSERFAPAAFGAYESTETTHFSIVDKAGNAVSLTYTLNGSYGSGVTAPGLGFLLNNEMDDFAAQPGSPNMFGLVQGERNAIQPGKRPLSSMTPTILTRDGKLFMVVGGPGGGRIITSVLQTILNVVDFGMNVQDAVDAPVSTISGSPTRSRWNAASRRTPYGCWNSGAIKWTSYPPLRGCSLSWWMAAGCKAAPTAAATASPKDSKKHS